MKQAASSRNNGGFTLTEVMVALVVMVIGMVGLLQALGIAFEHNLRNQLREEAVYVGEKYIADLRGKGFDRYSTDGYGPRYAQSQLRGGKSRYTVEQAATKLDNDVIQLQVVVRWKYKGVDYQNRVVSTVSRPLS